MYTCQCITYVMYYACNVIYIYIYITDRTEDAKISAVRAAAAGQHLKRIDVIWLRCDFFSAKGYVDAAVLAGLHGAAIFQAGVSKPQKQHSRFRCFHVSTHSNLCIRL